MGDLETRMLENYHLEPYLWDKFIDDILSLWTHGLDELLKFHEYINSFHQTIKFTMEYSMEKLVSLDTWAKRLGDHLVIEIYTKPTDTHNYLHFTFSHPRHLKRGGPYSQFLRVRRNCTLLSDYDKHSQEMKNSILTERVSN